MNILFLVLRILIGVAFAAAGFFKLSGNPMMVQEFDVIGLGQWFRYVTGLCEVVGVLLLIRPRTVTLGAGLLTCVCIGAFFAQLLILHGDVIHTIVLGGIAAAVAWHYRSALALR